MLLVLASAWMLAMLSLACVVVVAFILKENLGSAPTDSPGWQELSKDKHATVVSSFKGRQ